MLWFLRPHCNFSFEIIKFTLPYFTLPYLTLVVVVIAFKGTIRKILQSPHCAVNHLPHIRSSGPGAIVCKSRATPRALITCNMSLNICTWESGLYSVYVKWPKCLKCLEVFIADVAGLRFQRVFIILCHRTWKGQITTNFSVSQIALR